jgi:hypothetical protein
MRQILLATAALIGMSGAALAAEPVALSDSQLDNVTAGQTIKNTAVPVVFSNGGGVIAPQAAAVLPAVGGPVPFPGTPGVTVGPTTSGVNLVTNSVTP